MELPAPEGTPRPRAWNFRYHPPDSASWFHQIYGHVPRHQLDFIYSPAAGHRELKSFCRGRLAELIKFIEPAGDGAPGFAIGNLSLGDTQFSPGRGGMGIVYGARVEGVRDHAGRGDAARPRSGDARWRWAAGSGDGARPVLD